MKRKEANAFDEQLLKQKMDELHKKLHQVAEMSHENLPSSQGMSEVSPARLGPHTDSQQELRALSLPAIPQQTSKNADKKPREATSVPLMANAVTTALVFPAVSQSVACPVPLAGQPVMDAMFSEVLHLSQNITHWNGSNPQERNRGFLPPGRALHSSA